MFCTRGRVGSAKTPLLLTYDQFDPPVLDTRHPALPCSRFVLNRVRLWSFKGDYGALIHFRPLGAYPGEPGFLRRRGAEGYFAWGCFSIFLFRSANEALIELAPPMSHLAKRTQWSLATGMKTGRVHFGRTNPNCSSKRCTAAQPTESFEHRHAPTTPNQWVDR